MKGLAAKEQHPTGDGRPAQIKMSAMNLTWKMRYAEGKVVMPPGNRIKPSVYLQHRKSDWVRAITSPSVGSGR